MANPNIAPSREADYPINVAYAHASVLDGLRPEVTDGTYALWASYSTRDKNVYDTMRNAMSDIGGSPYELVEAFDPDDAIDSIADRFTTFDGFVADLDPDAEITAAMSRASTEVDAEIGPTTYITAVVNASETRTRGQHLRDVSRAAVGFFETRSVMSTTYDVAMAYLEAQRQLQLNDESTRLHLQAQMERTDAILRLADAYLAQVARRLEAERIATALNFDIKRAEVTAKQDQTEFNLDVETRDATWDLELFAYHAQALGSLQGISTLPRATSGRERLLAAITNSASAGLQFGIATGKPGLGLLSFGGMLAAQLYGLGGNG